MRETGRLHRVVSGWMWLLAASAAMAQAPIPPTAATNGVSTAMESAATEPAMLRPTTILAPSLSALQTAMAAVKLEKWKMSNEMRDATDADLRSLERDFRDTLPPLLSTADADPGSLAKVLPVMRNVDAAYDVAVRVSAAGRLAAPAPQSAALDAALRDLDAAKRKMGDQLQAAAVAEDGRTVELQASLDASRRALTAARTAPTPVTATKSPTRKAATKRVSRPKPPSGGAGQTGAGQTGAGQASGSGTGAGAVSGR